MVHVDLYYQHRIDPNVEPEEEIWKQRGEKSMVTNLRKGITALLVMLMVIAFSACGRTSSNTEMGSSGNQIQAAQNTESSSEPDTSTIEATQAAGEQQEGDAAADQRRDDTGKILVVYFSWSGHLDSMAHWVADETGGELYRVTAKDPYPENYNDTADRAKQEQDGDVRPEIVVDITEEQMAQYDTVFFGFPVWWYDLPMPMWTFLESYDLSGKTIIPFFSHEGSSNGAGALPTVETLAIGATIRSDDELSIRGGNVSGAENEVREWVKGLEY